MKDPLVPFSIFRLQTLTAANIVGFILGTALFAMFLMLTLYMQQVLGLSPIETGVGYLAVAGTAIIWANVAAAAVTRVGVKPALVFGMALMTVGLLYFTQVSVDGSYWTDLFPGFLIIGLGMPFAYVAGHDRRGRRNEAARKPVWRRGSSTRRSRSAARSASRSSRRSRSTTTNDAVATGTQAPVALTDGFQAAFWAGAAIAFVGVLVSVFLVRGRTCSRRTRPASSPRSSRRLTARHT